MTEADAPDRDPPDADPRDRDDAETLSLLRRWNAGEGEALDAILARERDWLEGRVRARLGPKLRQKAETEDFVQDALLEFFRYGPRFEVQSRRHLRGLLGRIVENALRGKAKWFDRQRRQLAAERPLDPRDTLSFEPAAPTAYRPSRIAQQGESEARLRLAVELLDPADREVIVLRQWEELPFAEVAARLGIQEDAARMRLNRALKKLVAKVRALEQGDLDAALDGS